MQVSQVAYDRFVLELPPADASWRPLADPEVLAETAGWLWDFGPKPLIAVVGYDGATPTWLTGWSPRVVRLAPHERTVLLWPRNKEPKTFEALSGSTNDWLKTVDAHANIQRGGEVFEVHQLQG